MIGNKCVTVPPIWAKRLQKDNSGNLVIRNKGTNANGQPKLGWKEGRTDGRKDGRKERNGLVPEDPASPCSSPHHPPPHRWPLQRVCLLGLEEACCSSLLAKLLPRQIPRVNAKTKSNKNSLR